MNAAESAPCLSLPATHVAFDEIARQHAIAGTIAAREKLVRGTAAAGNESENAMANRSLAKGPSDTCVLVTGGAGFIGSHTCVELLNRGYRVVVLDDLSNSSEVALDRVRAITGVGDDRLAFYEASILDREALDRVFAENDIDAIIHFAGFKAVGESVQKPLEYYWNNVAGTLVLCEAARAAGCKNLVFSSSATVYGEPEFIPITEDCPKHEATNPYGQTKSMLEQVLIKSNVTADRAAATFSKYDDNCLFMPIVNFGKKSYRKILESYERLKYPLLAYEICWSEYTPEVETCMREVIAGGSKLWVNSLWPSLNGGLCDDAAVEGDPAEVYGKLVDMGATMIQTDRPELLISYLRSRGLHD